MKVGPSAPPNLISREHEKTTVSAHCTSLAPFWRQARLVQFTKTRSAKRATWHCRLDSVLPWRRTLYVRFTLSRPAKRARLRRNGLCRSWTTRKRKEIHCRNGSATWHCRPDSVLFLRRTLYARFTRNRPAKTSSLLATRKRKEIHCAELSSRQCSLPGDVLVRIYAEPTREEAGLRGIVPRRSWNKETERDSLPKRQCHGGTVAPTVLSSCDVPCTFDLRGTDPRRGRAAQKRTSSLLDYKETERDSLPRRQCHGGTVVPTVFSSWRRTLYAAIYAEPTREEGPFAQNRPSSLLDYKEKERDSLPKRQCHVALSSRQCSSLATYLVRSIYAEPTHEEAGLRRNGLRRSQATRKRKKTHCRNGSATWHCRPDSVLFLRRTLYVRFTREPTREEAGLRRIVPRRSQATRKRKKIHCRNGSATWHCRPDSVLFLATYLVRSIYAEPTHEEGPFAQNRPSVAPGLQCQEHGPCTFDLRGTDPRRGRAAEDSLPRRQCHVALSSRQCSLPATYLVRSIYAEPTREEAGLRGIVPRRSQATRKRKKIHCRNGSATEVSRQPSRIKQSARRRLESQLTS